MTSLYQKWMYAWETRLTTRDTNRVVRPLEWGMDWARRWPLVRPWGSADGGKHWVRLQGGLPWATRRTGATGREGRRSRSRFLDGLVPAAARPRVDGPDARMAGSRPAGDGRAPKVDSADRSPLSNALRAWRTARARADAVAPFIVFHDSTIEAIAARRPRSMAELRRVPGVGPMKLDRYGEEIIGVVVREG
jgi:superfamily II DNA helicase RecQ